MEFGAEHDDFSNCDYDDFDIDKGEAVSPDNNLRLNDNIPPAKTEEGGSLEDFDMIDDVQSTNDSILSTADSGIQRDTNSLASDHIDVDALLRHSSRGRHSSPLATIKEIMRESSGRKSTSSQVSLDGASVDGDRIDVHSSEKSNTFQSSLSGDLSRVSDDADKLAIENHRSQSFDDDAGDEFDCNGFDLGGGGFSDDEESQISEQNHTMVDEHDANDSIEVSAKQVKRKRRKPLVKKERRKTFPPGPLCSLQMLDLIEDGSLNTPLWRNGKRKRCTLTSMKRARAKNGRSY